MPKTVHPKDIYGYVHCFKEKGTWYMSEKPTFDLEHARKLTDTEVGVLTAEIDTAKVANTNPDQR